MLGAAKCDASAGERRKREMVNRSANSHQKWTRNCVDAAISVLSILSRVAEHACLSQPIKQPMTFQ